MNKQAILFVHFGTGNPDIWEKSIHVVEKTAQDVFPEWEIRGALTGDMILHILKKQGLCLQSVSEALETLYQEGMERVVIQPTHLLYGTEYEKLKAQADRFREKFREFSVGKPLLASESDAREICRFYSQKFSLEKGEALVLMGHGCTAFSNDVYFMIHTIFEEMGFPQILAGAMIGSPGIEWIRERLKQMTIRKVTLAPMMLVAGSHAARDMTGHGPDSWQSRLEADGYAVNPILCGLGEYPEFRNFCMERVRQLIE